MELSGYFDYAGVDSFTYDLQMVNIDTSRDLRIVGEIEPATCFIKKGLRNNHSRDRYEDAAISIDVEFYRESGNIDKRLRGEIEKWLFGQGTYRKLYIFEHGVCGTNGAQGEYGRDGVYLNCRFLNPVKIEDGGGVVGYRATLVADSSFAWEDEVEQAFAIIGGSTAANTSVTVVVDSDLPEYIWPRVTIQTGSTGGNVTIINQTDDSARLTAFSGLTAETQVIMNGETNYISGQNYQKFSSKNFIRLLDGENIISVTGDVVSIKFSFRNRRYL